MLKFLLWFVVLHDLILTVLWVFGINTLPAFIGGLIFFSIILLEQYKDKREEE